MKDLEIMLANKPGSLAALGEILGRNHISLEGGGVFSNGAFSIAHFLVEEAERAADVLLRSGIKGTKINEVIILKLRQDIPGQLGAFCRRLAEAGINIKTQYSDHSNQLIIVADDHVAAKIAADKWMKEFW